MNQVSGYEALKGSSGYHCFQEIILNSLMITAILKRSNLTTLPQCHIKRIEKLRIKLGNFHHCFAQMIWHCYHRNTFSSCAVTVYDMGIHDSNNLLSLVILGNFSFFWQVSSPLTLDESLPSRILSSICPPSFNFSWPCFSSICPINSSWLFLILNVIDLFDAIFFYVDNHSLHRIVSILP